MRALLSLSACMYLKRTKLAVKFANAKAKPSVKKGVRIGNRALIVQ